MPRLVGRRSSGPCGIDPIGNLLQTELHIGLLSILLSVLETLQRPACLALKEITVLIFLDCKDPAASNI